MTTPEETIIHLDEKKMFRRITDRPENHHAIDNEIFNEYVRDEKDIVGMLAYCFYKHDKVKICAENPHMPSEEIIEKCREFIKPRKYAENREKAANALGAVEKSIISDYAKKKSKRDWFIGIGSGIIAALLAPWLYTALSYAITASGVGSPLKPINIIETQPTPTLGN